jgi:hypothetical protein
MNNVPDYTVVVLTEDGRDLFSLDLKIKHSRQMIPNGRAPSQYGGQTVIFEQNTNTVFSARCRMSEQFSRRKGLMTCLQKLLHQIPFRGLEATYGKMDILTFDLNPNGMTIYVGTATEENRNSWM